MVVVGGGISGLAAAWFYREAHGSAARILILENHDDFGGHAKRNEFRVGDRLLLGYGGTESLQSPKTFFSKTVNRLLRSLGVDLRRFDTAFDRKLYRIARPDSGCVLRPRDLRRGQAGRRQPGRNGRRLVCERCQSPPHRGRGCGSSRCRMTPERRLIEFFAHPKDYLAGKSKAEKIAYLKKISYRDFLRKDAGLGDEAVKFFDASTFGLMAMGPDILPALDAMSEPVRRLRGLGARRPQGSGNRGIRRALHLPFPRRQCVDRATAGPQS